MVSSVETAPAIPCSARWSSAAAKGAAAPSRRRRDNSRPPAVPPGRGAVPVASLGSQEGSRSRPRVGELGLGHLVGAVRPSLALLVVGDGGLRAANSFSASAARASEAATIGRGGRSRPPGLDAERRARPARPAWPDLRGSVGRGAARRTAGPAPRHTPSRSPRGADGRRLVERRGDLGEEGGFVLLRAWAPPGRAAPRGSPGRSSSRRRRPGRAGASAPARSRPWSRGGRAATGSGPSGRVPGRAAVRPQRTRPRGEVSRDRRSVRVCSRSSAAR